MVGGWKLGKYVVCQSPSFSSTSDRSLDGGGGRGGNVMGIGNRCEPTADTFNMPTPYQ